MKKENEIRILKKLFIEKDGPCRWSELLNYVNGYMKKSALGSALKQLKEEGYVISEKRGDYRFTEKGEKRLMELENPLIPITRRTRESKDNSLKILEALKLNKTNKLKLVNLQNLTKLRKSELTKELRTMINKEWINRINFEYGILEKGKSKYEEEMEVMYGRESRLISQLSEIKENKEKIKKYEELFKEKIDTNTKHRLILNLMSVKSEMEEFIAIKTLHFISLNHPSKYPNYISLDDFSDKYHINKNRLKLNIEEIVLREKLTDNVNFKCFELKVDEKISYYFFVNHEQKIRAVVNDWLSKFIIFDIEKKTLKKEIVNNICNDKILDKGLRKSFKAILSEYLHFLNFELGGIKQIYYYCPITEELPVRLQIAGIEKYKKSTEEIGNLWLMMREKTMEEISDNGKVLLILNGVEEFLEKELNKTAAKHISKALEIEPNNFKILNFEATIDFLNSKRSEAIRKFKYIVKENKNYMIALNNLARSYFLMEDYENALKIYHEIIEIEPNNLRVQFELSQVYQKKEDYNNAIKIDLKILKKRAKNQVIWEHLANLYNEKGDYDKAIEIYKEKLDLNEPKTLAHMAFVYYNMANYEESIILLKKANNLIKKTITENKLPYLKDSVSIWHFLAHAYEKIKDMENGINAFKIAIELEPENAIHCFHLGQLYGNMKKYEKAINYCEKALELDPVNSLIWNEIALLYNKMKNYPQALTAHNNAIKYAPTNNNNNLDNKLTIIRYGLNLLRFYLEKKEYNLAMKAGQKILNLYPNNFEILNDLGRVYVEMKKFDKALNLYNKAYEINQNAQNKLQFLRNLGELYYKMKKYNEAIKFYRELTELEPENPNIWSNIAVLFGYLKNHDDAINAYKKALELAPEKVRENARLWHEMAIEYQNKGEEEDGINAFRKAIELEPENFYHWYHLGDLLYYMTEKDEIESIEIYQKALSLINYSFETGFY